MIEDIATGRLLRLLEDWTPPRPGFSLYCPGGRNQSAEFTSILAIVSNDLRLLSGMIVIHSNGLRWCDGAMVRWCDGDGMNATGSRECPNGEFGPTKTICNR